MSSEERRVLELRALLMAREFGHTIPRIEWDAARIEGIGTCVRCGDGVLVYADGIDPNIGGTAATSPCPGDTCDHGWHVMRTTAGGVTMRCGHCGAERREQ
jgi:hypothetical protein